MKRMTAYKKDSEDSHFRDRGSHSPEPSEDEKMSKGPAFPLHSDNHMASSVPKRTILKVLGALHFNIFLYSTCFWIQTGVLPLIGSPLYGRFGDLFGGRMALLLAFLSAGLTYFLLSVASNIPLLFLSRIPSIGMHSIQGSQMVVTDVTDSKGRSDALGKIGISYGLGMIVGPFIGGLITERFDEQSAALAAAFGSLLSVLLVFVFIPSNTKAFQAHDSEEKEKIEKTQKDMSIFDIKHILSLLKNPAVAYLLLVKCVVGLPFGIFQAMFSIVAMEYFKLGPKENGMVLSYVGILGMLIQGFGVGLLSKRFSDGTLLKWAVASISLAYLFLIIVTDIYTFCVVLIPLAFGGSIMQVVITSAVTKVVKPEETGQVLGLSMATHALIKSGSPTIGGLLFSRFGFPVFGIVGFAIDSIATVYLFLYGKDI